MAEIATTAVAPALLIALGEATMTADGTPESAALVRIVA